jgi:hypothetical protein
MLLCEPLCSKEPLCNCLSRMVNDIGLVRNSQWASLIKKSFLGGGGISDAHPGMRSPNYRTYGFGQRQTWSNCTLQVYKKVHFKLGTWLSGLIRIRRVRTALSKFTKLNITPRLRGESPWCSCISGINKQFMNSINCWCFVDSEWWVCFKTAVYRCL